MKALLALVLAALASCSGGGGGGGGGPPEHSQLLGDYEGGWWNPSGLPPVGANDASLSVTVQNGLSLEGTWRFEQWAGNHGPFTGTLKKAPAGAPWSYDVILTLRRLPLGTGGIVKVFGFVFGDPGNPHAGSIQGDYEILSGVNAGGTGRVEFFWQEPPLAPLQDPLPAVFATRETFRRDGLQVDLYTLHGATLGQ